MELFRVRGLIAMLIAWVMLVVPTIKSGVNSRVHTITYASTLDAFLYKKVSLGLFVGAVFQLMFLVYLSYKAKFAIYEIGSLLYISCNLATVWVGVLDFIKYSKIHIALVSYYFVMMPIACVLISYYVSGQSAMFYFSVFLMIGYLIGEVLILTKIGIGAWFEIWAFGILSVWTIMYTLR